MHKGWEAVQKVSNSGLQANAYRKETFEFPHQLLLEAEDDHVIYQFTLSCKTGKGGDYINDYIFFIKCRDGRVASIQEYVDTKQFHDLTGVNSEMLGL